MLDTAIEKADDSQYEEDRECLARIAKEYGESSVVCLVVNPAVKAEIEKTKDYRRRKALMRLFRQFRFTPFNKSVFPWFFPVAFLQDEEKKKLKAILEPFPGFKKDEKVFADAVFNSQIDVLLTTDREHLKSDKLSRVLHNTGLHKKIKVFTPKELLEYLQNAA